MAKITRKTGRMNRMGAVVGAIMSGVFAFIGFFIPGSSPVGDLWGDSTIWYNEAGDIIPSPMGDGFSGGLDIFGAFRIGWIVICLAICVFCIYMAIKGEGIPTETVDVDSDGDPLIQVRLSDAPKNEGEPPADFEQRLRKLKSLRDDGLISQAEYEEKRKKIMDEKW